MDPMIIIGLVVALALLVLAIIFASHKATKRKPQGRRIGSSNALLGQPAG
jgi:hypothetical protein